MGDILSGGGGGGTEREWQMGWQKQSISHKYNSGFEKKKSSIGGFV